MSNLHPTMAEAIKTWAPKPITEAVRIRMDEAVERLKRSGAYHVAEVTRAHQREVREGLHDVR